MSLDTEVPERLDTPHGGALFVSGCCAHEAKRLTGISLSLGGISAEAMAMGMPRQEGPGDLYGLRDAGSIFPPERREDAELSGFWAIVPVPAVEQRRDAPLELTATLKGGGVARATLATLRLEPSPGPDGSTLPGAERAGTGVTICMATIDPSPGLFAAQLESIRAQTYADWRCVICDDGSRAEVLEEMREVIAGDPRFSLSTTERSVGAYRGFERALSLVPADARYVAFADQHGRWAPTKLAALVAALETGAQLAYTDMRVIDPDGAAQGGIWNDDPVDDPIAVLVRSPVPGVAAAFRRELLEYALPFPARLGPRFRHDDWLTLVATALGRVTRVRSCLHEHVPSFPEARPSASRRRAGARARIASAPFGWRDAYFADYCRALVLARVLAERCETAMSRRKRRSLLRFARADTGGHLATLAPRALGLRGRGEAASSARRLLRAMVWPAMIQGLTRWRPALRRYLDASLPPSVRDAVALHPKRPPGAAELDRRLGPLPLSVSATAPLRVNILLPAIDLEGLFGGYMGIYNLARRLAECGLRPRLVPVGHGHARLPANWKAQIEGHGELAGLFERVEVEFPREGGPLEASADDTFVASSWWTAHVAHRAIQQLGGARFVYLIQDFEPSFYPAGSWAALARESYGLPHVALFSTELLRDYFRRHRIGVFSGGVGDGEQRSISFQHAITPIDPPALDDLDPGRGKRLLFYARPEEYAPRNLFDVAVMALANLVQDGTIESDWQLTGVGTVTGAQRIALGGDVNLELIPRQAEERYVDLLRKHDLGLSLMYSPHPSLVPLEMASAGMITITNSFENKTPQALAAISENLIAVEPTLEGIKRGIREGIVATADLERRHRGAEVEWSRSWNSSLDDAVMHKIVAWLDEH